MCMCGHTVRVRVSCGVGAVNGAVVADAVGQSHWCQCDIDDDNNDDNDNDDGSTTDTNVRATFSASY